MKHRQATWYVLLALILMLAGCSQKPEANQASPSSSVLSEPGSDPESDVPYVPTPQYVVEGMLELANVTEDDVVYDLGSGDGRIVITAAKEYGARGVGIEIDSQRVENARQKARDAGVADLVEFQRGDLFEADISEASVVTLYLLPSVNLALRPKLFDELEPGARVVSHDFDMDEWQPEKSEELGNNTIFLWTIPDEVPTNLED